MPSHSSGSHNTQHVTPTSHSTSLAVTHTTLSSKVYALRCTHTHKVPTFGIIAPSQLCLEGTRRPGKPNVNLCQCFSVCGSQMFYQCVFLLPVHQAAYLAGLQFPDRAAPLSTWVSGALGSPEGQWEGCDPTRPPAQPRGDWSVGLTVGVMSHFRANKTFEKCDSCCSVWWMSRWVRTSFNLRWKCEISSLSLGSRSIKV